MWRNSGGCTGTKLPCIGRQGLYRTRSCTNPKPKYGGRSCRGPSIQWSFRPCKPANTQGRFQRVQHATFTCEEAKKSVNFGFWWNFYSISIDVFRSICVYVLVKLSKRYHDYIHWHHVTVTTLFLQSMVIGVVGVDRDQLVLARRGVGGAKD